jgi:hypothetical protein
MYSFLDDYWDYVFYHLLCYSEKANVTKLYEIHKFT